MRVKFACLSLAAFAFASCDKGEPEANPEDTTAKQPRVERRTSAPAGQTRRAIDPPISHPVDASAIRPAGTAPEDGSWETLTAEQMIEKFNSSGIARMPRYVSDEILSDATSAGVPEDQVRFIREQSAAWHHIDEFKKSNDTIPDHMKMALLENLSKKHGASLKDMIPELDEQVAASAKVAELRLKGIPGMSPGESQDFMIQALEKHGADYKAILSIANQSAKE